ncbi:CRISPR-associated helicase/endonuclease Cas3 [Zavarzinella formosa]|uniref:CRISPR-associated helicase/endonuclease Cas3 n=1 Tax=Zavarzinella formosa TaxID=360055 RepID=UPI0003032F14|nr:CRISPR-associated helicase/endonuclease Cas3 [Zavarzinella formosa]
MSQEFVAFFGDATQQSPFPYQIKFATGKELPHLVHAPTGAGKTATAIIGWLWRYFSGKPTPRRLVYCLPMRVLVEQTVRVAKDWIKALKLDVPVHVLMGGESAEEWDLEPEKPAILIGTQDMLLSRALNRGYGMSRFRWPMHFGLVNSDCLWIFDEIQLMGVGLATSSQLQAFRETLGTYGKAQTIWMSATLLPDWLATVDYRKNIEPELKLDVLKLNPVEDYQADGLKERWEAWKPIEQAALNGENLTASETKDLAKFVVQKHIRGSLTLVIVNTVDRCRGLFEAIQEVFKSAGKHGKKAPLPGSVPPAPDLQLIHSRFRPKERETWKDWLTQNADELINTPGRIVVSTQVVEAGVDISARTLITELAPWPSLVQRFGRCNRRGEFLKKVNPAQIFWTDVPTTDDKKAAPYDKDELIAARSRITMLPGSDAGLKSLSDFFDSLDDEARDELFPFDPPHVIRRKDFVDLFDTTPDLAGNDIDVSRFIRDGDEIDVQVFWRAGTPPLEELKIAEGRRIAPVRDELCTVKIGEFKAFLADADHVAHHWDALASKWVKAEAGTVYPGQVYWLTTAIGGYDPKLGWKPGEKWPADLWNHDPDKEPEPKTTQEPSYDTDIVSISTWRSIAEHTDEVLEELNLMFSEKAIKDSLRKAVIDDSLRKAVIGDALCDLLALAARWHDWGKAHCIFQDAIKKEANGKQRPEGRDLAKAPKGFWDKYKKPHFRHELASALGVLRLLAEGQAPAEWASLSPTLQNLAVYLIAAHHGKVRLSIRSMPGEKVPDGLLFARGVWQDDILPSVQLGGKVMAPSTTLDLTPMKLGMIDGRPSWAERMLGLRDNTEFGPLRLAYLEALVRAADIRASKKADEEAEKKAQKAVPNE